MISYTFDHTHDLSAVTSSNPFTLVQLCAYLDGEQSLLTSDSKHLPAPNSITLSAQAKHATPVACANCKWNSHIAAYCISPGSGMASKSIEESKQACCCDCGQKEDKIVTTPAAMLLMATAQKGRVSVKLQGADGCTYYMTVNAACLASASGPTVTDFVGIAETADLPSAPIPQTATIEQLDTDEYMGWLAIEEENVPVEMPSALNISITHDYPYNPASELFNTSPFWLDTRESVHITPELLDFTLFKAIPS